MSTIIPHQAPSVVARKGTALDAARAFGVMIAPSALFDLFLAGSVMTMARWLLSGHRSQQGTWLRSVAAVGTAVSVAYPTVIRPWMLRWGATDEERRAPLLGDDLVPNPATSSTRAITVDAPVEAVWPWLAQLGQDRGGFYSYEWLENLAGCHMRNAERIHAEWQWRDVGEIVKLHWASGCKVAAFEPNHALVLEGWGAFVVEPLDAAHARIILRSRVPRGWPAILHVLAIELPHFLMERQMLLGIKACAERAYSAD